MWTFHNCVVCNMKCYGQTPCSPGRDRHLREVATFMRNCLNRPIFSNGIIILFKSIFHQRMNPILQNGFVLLSRSYGTSLALSKRRKYTHGHSHVSLTCLSVIRKSSIQIACAITKSVSSSVYVLLLVPTRLMYVI